MNYTAKINLKQIVEQHVYKGAKGDYLDVVLFEYRDGPDQYGNSHYIAQSVSKEARQRGEKGPIIGNAKPLQAQQSRPKQQADDEDVPY